MSKQRIAIVGTGHRGAGTWGRELLTSCGEHVELVGLSDVNPLRLEVARRAISVDVPTSTNLADLISTARPQTLIVCSRDDSHADHIVLALEAGVDVVTEKPMTTTAEMCGHILDAEKRTGKRIDVAFNYRFAPTSRRIKELLVAGAVGDVTSVDFHWYLDTWHGADYFRRWHAFQAFSGGLFVHKATHHFDLLNWFLDADPIRISAQGALRQYGNAGPFRGERCKTCAHARSCDYHYDVATDPWLDALYEAPSKFDDYFRDACVFREEIDIFDTMTAVMAYENGVQVSYSLNCFMPIEGYHLAFNGTRGRIEVRMYERQAFEMPGGVDEIAVLGNDRSVQRIHVEHGQGGHFGGDPLLQRMLFAPHIEDPLNQRAGSRAGAMSVLCGIAATKSAVTGSPVEIRELMEPLAGLKE
ncbi:MAG: Gfo/Idh/MocA family oxidoreductase [Pseudomonadota bacterium]